MSSYLSCWKTPTNEIRLLRVSKHKHCFHKFAVQMGWKKNSFSSVLFSMYFQLFHHFTVLLGCQRDFIFPTNWIIKNCSKIASRAGTCSLQKSTATSVQAKDSRFYQRTPALMLPALIQCLFWGEEAALFYLLIHPIYLSLYLKGDLKGGLKRLVTFYKGNIWWNCSFISPLQGANISRSTLAEVKHQRPLGSGICWIKHRQKKLANAKISCFFWATWCK